MHAMRDAVQEGGGGSVHGTVLEPCKAAVVVDMRAGGAAGDVQLKLSDLRLNVSPDVLELAAALQASLLEPLILPPADRRGLACFPLHAWASSCKPSHHGAVMRTVLQMPCPACAILDKSHAYYMRALRGDDSLAACAKSGRWRAARASCAPGATRRSRAAPRPRRWTRTCWVASAGSPSGGRSRRPATPV